jgi:peroxin-14
MSTRQDLVRSAVNFLRDPKVQASPLQKRVAFLESKGLTSEEIEAALREAKEGVSSSPPPSLPAGQQPMLVQQPPTVPRLDWRDYFVAAVLIGGIGFAIATVVKVDSGRGHSQKF